MLIALSNVLMFYAAVYLSFHFHFLRIIVLPFQKLNKVVCVRVCVFSRFNTIPQRDRRTDRQTDRIAISITVLYAIE